MVLPLLRRIGFSLADSASLAGHHGSVSVVTFAVLVCGWWPSITFPFNLVTGIPLYLALARM